MKNLQQILRNLNESDNFMNEDELMEDALFEDSSDTKEMSETDLKVESLKIATNIAKLMSNVTPDDIISIATKVSDFIKNHEIGSDEKKEDDFDINDELK